MLFAWEDELIKAIEQADAGELDGNEIGERGMRFLHVRCHRGSSLFRHYLEGSLVP